MVDRTEIWLILWPVKFNKQREVKEDVIFSNSGHLHNEGGRSSPRSKWLPKVEEK